MNKFPERLAEQTGVIFSQGLCHFVDQSVLVVPLKSSANAFFSNVFQSSVLHSHFGRGFTLALAHLHESVDLCECWFVPSSFWPSAFGSRILRPNHAIKAGFDPIGVVRFIVSSGLSKLIGIFVSGATPMVYFRHHA